MSESNGGKKPGTARLHNCRLLKTAIHTSPCSNGLHIDVAGDIDVEIRKCNNCIQSTITSIVTQGAVAECEHYYSFM